MSHILFYEPISIDFFIFKRIEFQVKIFIDINIYRAHIQYLYIVPLQ